MYLWNREQDTHVALLQFECHRDPLNKININVHLHFEREEESEY